MSNMKFDELDRERTIELVEQHHGVRLAKVGSRQKFLVDESGIPYLVLGGYGDWHGIPKDILDACRRPDGKLIVAKRLPSRILVYCCPLGTLLANEHKLSITAAADRQFNIGWSAGIPHIKEVREMRLELIGEVSFTDEAKEKERRSDKVQRLLAALSPDQREVVLASFKSKQD
jgi:hypothetical protein